MIAPTIFREKVLHSTRTIAAGIKETAVNCSRADIVMIPSHPGNSPFQAHLFVNNERTVTQETVKWLTSVGLAPARAL
jgi:hypothetical protein